MVPFFKKAKVGDAGFIELLLKLVTQVLSSYY